jgi:hypothetical protein
LAFENIGHDGELLMQLAALGLPGSSGFVDHPVAQHADVAHFYFEQIASLHEDLRVTPVSCITPRINDV